MKNTDSIDLHILSRGTTEKIVYLLVPLNAPCKRIVIYLTDVYPALSLMAMAATNCETLNSLFLCLSHVVSIFYLIHIQQKMYLTFYSWLFNAFPILSQDQIKKIASSET